MVGMTSYFGRAVLNHLTGKTPMFSMVNPNLALFTAAGLDDGTGFVEVSGPGYARVPVLGSSWNSASGVSPVSASNSAPIVTPNAGGLWGNVVAWGLYDSATIGSGNLEWWDWMGPYDYAPFYCTAGSPGVLNVSQHGFQANDLVAVTAEFGGTLPTTPGSWIGLLTVGANPTADTFSVGINTTSSGDGCVRKVVPQTIGLGVSLTFNPSTMTLEVS